MADTSKNSSTPSYYDPNAIFFELSPKLVWLVRIVNIIALFMVLLSVIMCFVQGHKENHSYYLLIGNLILSGFVGIVVNWWFKTGDLGSEKYWYILLVSGVILLQCVMTDVFIFKSDSSPAVTTPTPRPHNSTVPFPWTIYFPNSHGTWYLIFDDFQRVDMARKTAIIHRELSNLNIDIAAFQETHLPSNGSLKETK